MTNPQTSITITQRSTNSAIPMTHEQEQTGLTTLVIENRSFDGHWPQVIRRALLALVMLAISAPSALGAPSQEEVFRSISDNVGGTVDGKKFFAFMAAAAGVILLLAVLSNRKKRQSSPKVLNHSGKLLKEVSRKINLRPAEIRQLKTLADAQGVSSPLTLLLCPSVLSRAVKERSGKVDRKAILSVVKKLG